MIGQPELVLGVEYRTFQPFQHISDVNCGLLHGALKIVI